jgi:hypothetical protein
MNRNITFFILLSITLLACEKKTEKITDTGDYISIKWKKTKDLFIESDSVTEVKKSKYYAALSKKYPEYDAVKKWFASKPIQLQNLDGTFYKMLSNNIVNNKSVTHEDLHRASDVGTYKYLFVNDDAYYIYDLSERKGKIFCKGVRRIKKGYGKKPIHDLEFKNGVLTREVFQADVEQDLFTKDGLLYFQWEKEVDGGEVTNTVNLGPERDF